MNKQSTMFLCDVTTIDHAYISREGLVVGGSVRPKFLISGNVDPLEQVVVDFSTIKKTLKQVIDDPADGWDHKLWFFEGISNGVCTFEDDIVVVKTDSVEITGPANIVKYVPRGESIGPELTRRLQQLYPDVDIQVAVNLTTDFDMHPAINSKMHMFRYSHGLKNSTSWGCQNIAHGHLSYIAAETTSQLATDLFLAGLANQLDGRMFVWEENIVKMDDPIEFGYDCARGWMRCTIPYENVILVNTETTIEHLVDFIGETFHDELKDVGVTKLFVSEGLSKGAVYNVE